MIIKDHITGRYTVISNKEMNKKDYFLSIIKRSYKDSALRKLDFFGLKT